MAIWGVVRRADDHTPIEGAIVVVQSNQLDRRRERDTDAEGRFVFEHLPAGTITIMVLYERADVSKVATMPPGTRVFASFLIDPSTR